VESAEAGERNALKSLRGEGALLGAEPNIHPADDALCHDAMRSAAPHSQLRPVRRAVILNGAMLFVLGLGPPPPPLSLSEQEPSEFLEVDGATLHYRDEGTGPAVVLLHGAGSSLRAWDAWSQALRSSHRVVRLDVPGYGLTVAPGDDFRPESALVLVDHFLVKRRLQSFALAGNSWGGHLAWRYALAHPDRVRGLILVDSAGYPGPAVLSSIRAPTLVLWGQKDASLPVELAGRFANDIPFATVKIFEGLGHKPMEEDGPRTVREAEAFLSELK
jgi:pimeloyl-ACP methyl ester carboxylesterase